MVQYKLTKYQLTKYQLKNLEFKRVASCRRLQSFLRRFGIRYLGVSGVVFGPLVAPLWSHSGVMFGVMLEFLRHAVFSTNDVSLAWEQNSQNVHVRFAFGLLSWPIEIPVLFLLELTFQELVKCVCYIC